MDLETSNELNRLRRNLLDAIAEVELAKDDDETYAAWRKVQTVGWELNVVLPGEVGSGHRGR